MALTRNHLKTILALSILLNLKLASAGAIVVLADNSNPDEPYGCNPPAKEYQAAHNGEEADFYSLKFKNWAYNNLPKKKLITLFNPSGKKIGCIENPDQGVKEHKVVIVAQDFPSEGEMRKDDYHNYSQEDLQKIYANATILKEVRLNDDRDIFALNRIHFAEEKIESILHESGVDQLCDQNIIKRMDFFRKQSLKLADPSDYKGTIKNTEEGKVDFFAHSYTQESINKSTAEYFEAESLFLTDGKAYNPHDFGNYLWGTAISRACLPCPVGRAAAHANTLMNLCLDNKSIKMAREAEGKKGCRIELDSPYDQEAIKNGCHGLYNNGEKTKMTCGEKISFPDETKNKHEGYFSYHIASNGSKILELKTDGKTETFIISSNDKGRVVQQMNDDQSSKSKLFENIDMRYSDLTDEQILGEVIKEKYKWKSPFKEISLSKEYPVGDLSFDSYLLNKIKVECGSVSRTSVSKAQEKCLSAGGNYQSEKNLTINYALTFDLNNPEEISKNKLALFRRGIFRKYNQQNTKSLKIDNGFQCRCKDEIMEVGLDECTMSNTNSQKRNHEAKDQ